MIFNPFERMVAWRYLRARREEGFVSVITGFSLVGIALGVATLIIVMSVMNGFRADLLARILGLNGHLGIYAVASPNLGGFDALAEKARGVPGVVSVTPVIEGQVMATAGEHSAGVVARAARQEDLKSRDIIAGHIVAGSLDDFTGRSAILIGARLAGRLGLSPGDSLRLVSPQTTVTAFGSVPRMKTFKVAAVFEIGMYEYDNSFVYMPLEAGQIYFRTGPDAVTNLEVMIADPDRVDEIRADIARALDTPVRLVDWQRQNAGFFNALQIERNVMFLILTMIILVAALNIIAGLIMLVKDKGGDIAILRTMGATRGMVMRIFFLAGSSIGVVGTIAGLALGVAFSRNIGTIQGWVEYVTGTKVFDPTVYFLTELPSRIETWDVVSVVALALGLAFLATLYPSWRAARLDPVEALRYE